jgi:aryl-alcohol dehydrogenase-like predicted oxidoreductase
MRQYRFGAAASVGVVGLGCMGMSWLYREAERDDEASVAVVRQALDLGVTMLDTADIYGDGHNEQLVGRALRGRRDEAFVATKVGLVVDDLTRRILHRDGSPGHVRRAVDASLRRLGVDRIDLLYLHRVDPAVPLRDTWGALAELVAAGKIRYLGLSEVTPEEADLAHELHPVAAVQSELSVWTRDTLPTVAWCARNGAAFVAFAPLGRGFLTDTVTDGGFPAGDFRASSPRFQPENLAANRAILDPVRTVAGRHDATPAQVAIAWVLARSDQVVAIPGTKKEHYLLDNAAAAELSLTVEDLAALDAAPVAAGPRY